MRPVSRQFRLHPRCFLVQFAFAGLIGPVWQGVAAGYGDTARNQESSHFVRDLRRRVSGGGRTEPHHRGGQDAGARGRVGLRQERDGPLHHAADPVSSRKGGGRRGPLPRTGPAQAEGRGDAADPRQRDLHGVPGAHDLAEPGVHRRRPDYGGHPPPSESFTSGGEGQGRGDAPAGEDCRSRLPRQRLPASDERRHAPARDDRHGAVLQPEPAHRRRADDGPGRDHSGPDPGSDGRASGQARHGPAAHYPRPRRRCGAGRRGRHHVCRPDGRARQAGGDLQQTAAPVHDRAAELLAQQHQQAAPGRYPRCGAESAGSSQRVPVPGPLLQGFRDLRRP